MRNRFEVRPRNNVDASMISLARPVASRSETPESLWFTISSLALLTHVIAAIVRIDQQCRVDLQGLPHPGRELATLAASAVLIASRAMRKIDAWYIEIQVVMVKCVAVATDRCAFLQSVAVDRRLVAEFMLRDQFDLHEVKTHEGNAIGGAKHCI